MKYNRLKRKSPKTSFSDNCMRNIFATISYDRFLLTSMKMNFVLKKSIEYLRKLTHSSYIKNENRLRD